MVDPTEQIHRISRIIAATRFPFVDQEDWGEGFQTIVNDEVNRFGIKWEGGITYPSIVILRADGGLQEAGMVEPVDKVNQDSVAKWRMLSESVAVGRVYKKLFLYVPHGLEEEALRLLEDNNIDYDGLRGYSIGVNGLKVHPFKTRNDTKDHR
jgi:hypothetical protein